MPNWIHQHVSDARASLSTQSSTHLIQYDDYVQVITDRESTIDS